MTRKPKPAPKKKRPTARFLRSAKTGRYTISGSPKATTVSEPRPIWTGWAFFGEQPVPRLYSTLKQATAAAFLYKGPPKRVALYLSRNKK